MFLLRVSLALLAFEGYAESAGLEDCITSLLSSKRHLDAPPSHELDTKGERRLPSETSDGDEEAEEEYDNTTEEAVSQLAGFDWITEADGERYEEERRPWNKQRLWKPLAIAFPDTEKQLSVILKCAAQEKVQVSALSGGHSYEGLGMGGRDGVLVINLRAFNQIVIVKPGPDKMHLVDVGPAVKIGSLYLHLFEEARLWFPPGLCPTLGIAGFILGGGVGFWSRLWGLGSDHVVAMRVCLASGVCVDTNESSFPDLFWGLRGAGGGNFGIVTNFRLRLRTAPDKMFVGIYKWYKARTMVQSIHRLINRSAALPRSTSWEIIAYSDRLELWVVQKISYLSLSYVASKRCHLWKPTSMFLIVLASIQHCKIYELLKYRRNLLRNAH